MGSPSYSNKKMTRDLIKMMSPKVGVEDGHLPPISGRRGEKKEQSSRLQRIGLEVLEVPRQQQYVRERVHSHHM